MISVDLFSGAGGLSCGLEMAGYKSVLANEIDPAYAKTYRHNFPAGKMIEGDIREVSETNLLRTLGLSQGDVDLLAGGPPCQGFSVNAPIRSLEDERNHLFKEYIKIADTLRPKAILIENVPGIVSLGQGTVVEQIYKSLSKLGYKVQHRILFAGHYGIPQTRFRTIFVGIHESGGDFRFPEPKYNVKAVTNFAGARELCLTLPGPLFADSLRKGTTISDAISDLPPIDVLDKASTYKYKHAAKSEYQKKLRNGSKVVLDHHASNLGPVNMERIKYVPQGGSWRDIPHDLLPKGLQRARRSDHTKRYGRLDPNGIGSTILTKCDPHWGTFFHPHQDRVITAREAARIQSFPDTFSFTGSLTDKYAQIGNAVPPLLGEALGSRIAETVRESYACSA